MKGAEAALFVIAGGIFIWLLWFVLDNVYKMGQ